MLMLEIQYLQVYQKFPNTFRCEQTQKDIKVSTEHNFEGKIMLTVSYTIIEQKITKVLEKIELQA